MKYELQNLIQGKGRDGDSDIIQKVTAFLRASKKASAAHEGAEYAKQQEEEGLIAFINDNNLRHSGIINEHNKIGEGAEQKVYYNPERGIVVKINDSIFFQFWIDYFHNLLIHNFFFPDTSYTLVGFRLLNDVLYAVVEQPHIIRTEDIDLENVKEFLKQNGFENTRRNDYYNKELGIILEDLHDENVISSNQIPFFVDTVFYLTDEFYKV